MKKKLISLFLILIANMFCYSQNLVSTYAGTNTPALINGDTAAARFKLPFGICRDKLGNLYVADGGNNCIRKITSTGTVTTLAGTGVAGYLDGASASAMFNNPTGVCVDDSFNVYVADFQNQRIRKISATGTVTTIAGSGTAGYLDGIPTLAQFNYPRGICRNKAGELFVGDSWNHRIRKIALNGTVSTYAGGGSAIGVSSVGSLVNAKDTAARFYTPCGLDADKNGNVYVADAYNHRIRRIDTARQVTVIAGSGSIGVGNWGYANGPVATASLNVPTEVSCDSNGVKIYIGDTFSNHVRFVTAGNLSNLAGIGTAGYVNGTDAVAQFNYPRGVVSDPMGTKVYVVDYNNNCVRKIILGTSTAIPSFEKKQEIVFSIYPNPNNGIFKIDNTKNSLIKIVDATGKVVFEGYSDPENNLNLAEFSNGIYTVIIPSEKSIVTQRFVKN